MAVTFDGPNLTITLETLIVEVDAQVDLYSDWKEWFKTPGNEVHPIAFDTTGGDPTTETGTVAPYFFLRNDNGWRIRPPEEDINITITGNLYPRDATIDMIIPTTGAFTVLVSIDRSVNATILDPPALTKSEFLALK